MKLGAERKKVAILAALGLAAVYLVYTNLFSAASGSSAAPEVRPPRSVISEVPAQATAPAPAPRARPRSARRVGDFRPSWTAKGGVDASSIDPRLRLDLLTKVQALEAGAAERNLFQFGQALVELSPPGGKDPGKIVPKTPPEIAKVGQAAPTGPPPPPPPPPITLKYYGYTAQRGNARKRAFFLDGDEIVVASEGELIKKRYKLIRIGVNSVQVEDTQFSNTQTLTLPEEMPG